MTADQRDEVAAGTGSAASTPGGAVEIWSDGACKGNPGVGGWGAWLRSGQHERELYGGELVTTNNRMELTAVIQALRALTRPCAVRLHVDSTYVMNGLNDWLPGWKRNGWRTSAKKPVKNADLWQALDAEVARHAVTWIWVKGHAGDPGNERADLLANRGVAEVRSRGADVPLVSVVVAGPGLAPPADAQVSGGGTGRRGS